MTPADASHPAYTRVLPGAFAGMCFVEAALTLGIVLHYKWSERMAELSPAGREGVGMALVLALLITGLMLVWASVRRATLRRAALLTIAMNIVTVAAIAGTAEIVLRTAVILKPAVTTLLPRGLLPRDWRQLAAENLRHLRDVTGDGSYMRADAELGWTVGESRRSHNGLYFSSTEGIRSAQPGISYAAAIGQRRIALVGDSFAFSEETSFEDSFGYHLGRALGEDFQVLNFGVPGYGADQAYLRFRRDVLPWNPDVAILVFTWHDLQRALNVYMPIAFPEWKMPYAKPRFILSDGKLLLKNVPVLTTEALLAERDPNALPLIELQPNFVKSDWTWHWYHNLYSVRFMLSLVPNWPISDEATRSSLIGINAAVLRAFVDSARAGGVRPMVAYFPTVGSGELDRPDGDAGLQRDVRDVFEAAGIEHFNGTSCLRGVDRDALYRPHGHYAGAGNAAMAACVAAYLKNREMPGNPNRRDAAGRAR